MSPRDYDYRPPEPRYARPLSAEPEKTDEDLASGSKRRPAGLIAAAVISGIVLIGLVIALGILWGNPTQPAALDSARDSSADPTESADGDSDLIGPDATNPPQIVAPGDTVPIEVDADFADGVTLVAPELGGWLQQDVINRPNQFTAYSPDYSAAIEVWQTGVFSTPQSDEVLTYAQLNRVSDECMSDVNVLGEPVKHLLEGEDDTKLEVLVAQVSGCDGGYLWLAERVMPLTGTRFHIVLWSSSPIEQNEALLEKFSEVTFTLS